MKGILGESARILRGLMGMAPMPFVPGVRLEVLMNDQRLVRGVVVQAGGSMAQLRIGMIGGFPDRSGRPRPGYPHLVLVEYAQVKATRTPSGVAPDGNWLHHSPHRDMTEALTTTPWKEFVR